jgi:hypothetical protein
MHRHAGKLESTCPPLLTQLPCRGRADARHSSVGGCRSSRQRATRTLTVGLGRSRQRARTARGCAACDREDAPTGGGRASIPPLGLDAATSAGMPATTHPPHPPTPPAHHLQPCTHPHASHTTASSAARGLPWSITPYPLHSTAHSSLRTTRTHTPHHGAIDRRPRALPPLAHARSRPCCTYAHARTRASAHCGPRQRSHGGARERPGCALGTSSACCCTAGGAARRAAAKRRHG